MDCIYEQEVLGWKVDVPLVLETLQKVEHEILVKSSHLEEIMPNLPTVPDLLIAIEPGLNKNALFPALSNPHFVRVLEVLRINNSLISTARNHLTSPSKYSLCI